MGYVKGEDRNQIIMFPDSIDEYITIKNPVRVIDAYVEGLNMEMGHGDRFSVPPMAIIG